MRHFKLFVELLRVRHWIKNAFVIFPLVFSGYFFEAAAALDNLLAFLGFCALASAAYLFNDIVDLNRDRAHPQKSGRPLARGAVTPAAAAGLSILLAAAGLAACAAVNPHVLVGGALFCALQIAYSCLLKRVVIFDVIALALGFQLRIWAGSLACGVLPSVWLQMCVLVLTLFLGFIKRRHEITVLGARAPEHRSVLAHYTSYLLDQLIMISATLTIVFYSLYTISPSVTSRTGGPAMVYSILFVLYGIFRYYYLVHVRRRGGDPAEVVLSDPPVLLTLGLWVVYMFSVTYGA